MKKSLFILSCLALSVLASACGNAAVTEPTPVSAPTVNIAALPAETPEPAMTAETQEPAETARETPESNNLDTVDVDLTQLSSTMVYSEVYAMVYEPEQYFGKTVKMQGLFATQEYNGSRLYACIVKDATACCSQGLEFELAEESVFPEDYPKPVTEITVVGTFDSYTEEADGNNYIYLVLRNAYFL